MQAQPVADSKHITEYNLSELKYDILDEKLFEFDEADIHVPNPV